MQCALETPLTFKFVYCGQGIEASRDGRLKAFRSNTSYEVSDGTSLNVSDSGYSKHRDARREFERQQKQLNDLEPPERDHQRFKDEMSLACWGSKKSKTGLRSVVYLTLDDANLRRVEAASRAHIEAFTSRADNGEDLIKAPSN